MPIINTVIQGGGTTPTGTKYITTNGVHDVTDYASADVQVPTTAPAYYVEKTKNANNKLVNNGSVIDLTGVTDVGDYCFTYAYYGCSVAENIDFSSLTQITGSYAFFQTFASSTNLKTMDLSSVTSVSGNYGCQRMFESCRSIISVDLSSLTSVGGIYGCQNMFNGCISLTTAKLDSLTQIISTNSCAGMFSNCSVLVNIKLSSLTTVNNDRGCEQMFYNCYALTVMDFDSLTTVTGSRALQQMFLNCTHLTKVSFYALTPSSFGTNTNQFNSMLQNVTDCTVHFPMAVQSTIGSWASVTAGFGGTNTTVLFDIVTSLTGADSNTYTRKQKESTSTATAWTYNDTLYYTSGTTEPTVGATIYSDSACTTAVTTISSIA